jgi:hypothetical protein
VVSLFGREWVQTGTTFWRTEVNDDATATIDDSTKAEAARAAPEWPDSAPPKTASDPSSEPSAAWPNILAWEGRLLALGAPETLCKPALAMSLIGGRELLSERVVRPVVACAATSDFDRKWLVELQKEFPEKRLALVGERLMLVPKAA